MTHTQLTEWLAGRRLTAETNKASSTNGVKPRFQFDIDCCDALLELVRQAAEGQGDCRQCERGVDTCVVHAATPTEPPPPVAQVKRCGTCRHFIVYEPGYAECQTALDIDSRHASLSVPDDGSGFCHLHSEGEK